MSILDRAVLATCAAAMVVGLAWQPIVDGLDRAHASVTGDPDAEQAGVTGVAAYRQAAEAVPVLESSAAEELLDACLQLPAGADPELHPDSEEVAIVATGRSTGAGMVVWAGPVAATGDAIGACVGMERAGEWRLANRSQKRDPGPGATQVSWSQFSSQHGTAAGVVGRVPDEVAEVLVVLDDGRILSQETRGVVAIVWSPVVRPERLVVIDRDDEIIFDGPVAAYG